jgi:hypothetical protein
MAMTIAVIVSTKIAPSGVSTVSDLHRALVVEHISYSRKQGYGVASLVTLLFMVIMFLSLRNAPAAVKRGDRLKNCVRSLVSPIIPP